MKQIENTPADDSGADDASAVNSDQQTAKNSADKSPRPKRTGAIIFVLLLLILCGAMAAGGYYAWQWLQPQWDAHQERLAQIEAQIDQLPTAGTVDAKLQPVSRSVSQLSKQMGELQQQQEAITDATEKLYDLYGRNENGWKLAEVEYLMSVAQHKLVLQQDFAGAAKTLDAAGRQLADLADPGLLPVRSLISEEIAVLKTRVRPDLAGMTLTLGRLARQVGVLNPEYVSHEPPPPVVTGVPAEPESDQPLEQRVRRFLTSLVTVKQSRPGPAKSTDPVIIPEVKQSLEDNLKLTRWALLERDAMQYQRLMEQNIELFTGYFDLNDAANAEFHQELLQLQKTSLRPELPDIGGSLRLLKKIQARQEHEAEMEESDNG
jgi:uroporphyrin-3 C-methyltransferase